MRPISDLKWPPATGAGIDVVLVGGEIFTSIERNSTALLKEVAKHALHGLDLAIFAAAQQARFGDKSMGELHALKAKLEDWLVANR